MVPTHVAWRALGLVQHWCLAWLDILLAPYKFRSRRRSYPSQAVGLSLRGGSGASLLYDPNLRSPNVALCLVLAKRARRGLHAMAGHVADQETHPSYKPTAGVWSSEYRFCLALHVPRSQDYLPFLRSTWARGICKQVVKLPEI